MDYGVVWYENNTLIIGHVFDDTKYHQNLTRSTKNVSGMHLERMTERVKGIVILGDRAKFKNDFPVFSRNYKHIIVNILDLDSDTRNELIGLITPTVSKDKELREKLKCELENPILNIDRMHSVMREIADFKASTERGSVEAPRRITLAPDPVSDDDDIKDLEHRVGKLESIRQRQGGIQNNMYKTLNTLEQSINVLKKQTNAKHAFKLIDNANRNMGATYTAIKERQTETEKLLDSTIYKLNGTNDAHIKIEQRLLSGINSLRRKVEELEAPKIRDTLGEEEKKKVETTLETLSRNVTNNSGFITELYKKIDEMDDRLPPLERQSIKPNNIIFKQIAKQENMINDLYKRLDELKERQELTFKNSKSLFEITETQKSRLDNADFVFQGIHDDIEHIKEGLQ